MKRYFYSTYLPTRYVCSFVGRDFLPLIFLHAKFFRSDVAETLSEIPNVLRKFWSVISEQRIADFIRQVSFSANRQYSTERNYLFD